MIKFYMGLGKTASEAGANTGVVLSPKEKDSKRGNPGNCQGNYSSKGHVYFGQPSKKVKGEERSFQLRYRNPVLVARVYDRSVKSVKAGEVKQEVKAAKAVKVAKVAKPLKKKTVKTVKAPAKKAKVVKVVEAESDWTPAVNPPAPIAEVPAVEAVESVATVEAPAVTESVEVPAAE